MILHPSLLRPLNIFNSRGFRDYLGKKSFWSKGKDKNTGGEERPAIGVEARIESRFLDTGNSSFYFQTSRFDTSIVTVKQYLILHQTGLVTVTLIRDFLYQPF